MASGSHGPNRLRFDAGMAGPPAQSGTTAASLKEWNVPKVGDRDRVEAAIGRTTSFMLNEQHEDGFWCAELEGDTILESEYILLLTYLGQERSETARKCAEYIRKQQLPTGGWAMYPGGKLEISGSVKAYLALKILGFDPNSEEMIRARNAIRQAGGAEKINSFTRYYLAMLGLLKYSQCPVVPPELILIPKWMPFNIYEMSSWSRTIVIPLSLLWAYQPVRHLPKSMHIHELFLEHPDDLKLATDPAGVVDDLKKSTRLNWDQMFLWLDSAVKVAEKLRIKPLRKVAINRAADWMTERFEKSDGLGAIFPPIVWSIIGLKCLGHSDDSPMVRAAMDELEALFIEEDDTIRLQPCKSPVWDTAIATIALRDAGVPRNHPGIRKSVEWLLSKEVKDPGDWSMLKPNTPPAGWYFEFNNEFYPDTDDTSMVVMALSRCLPSSTDDGEWQTQFLLGDWSPHEADRDASAVISGRGHHNSTRDVEDAAPILNAIWRGTKWMLSMQSKNGGWGAFDSDNDRELFTRVPFADHNAMIDPSTADITARIIEMFSHLNVPLSHPALEKAAEFVWSEQEPDGAWFGRWGVNYIYGTWQVLVGMTHIGYSTMDPRIQAGVRWLKNCQQSSGGWGETADSYDDPKLRGQGPATASQTAWALMGLMAAGEENSPEVQRGVEYLLSTQKDDGTWDEPWFTGTGFPKVFYLRYHYYRIYFPLMALGRYNRLRAK
ncbi:terpene cyclase/mutase family protein [Thalassoroseus pseudoceratinae]|uniref:terpene cyclase/mutase family protein n=1 Tax=Thalassoroseus pseudoceratinae TaxID=2713176 RepID=UPI001F102ECF|nr:terpene cyclase/mutase family protein [Thalassoroseus pseudoceratinae]